MDLQEVQLRIKETKSIKDKFDRLSALRDVAEDIANHFTESMSYLEDEIDFVLERYVQGGVEELDIDRLSSLITLKYKAIYDGQKELGNIDSIKNIFIEFQKYLYEEDYKNNSD